jgi:hypothetical protein
LHRCASTADLRQRQTDSVLNLGRLLPRTKASDRTFLNLSATGLALQERLFQMKDARSTNAGTKRPQRTARIEHLPQIHAKSTRCLRVQWDALHGRDSIASRSALAAPVLMFDCVLPRMDRIIDERTTPNHISFVPAGHGSGGDTFFGVSTALQSQQSTPSGFLHFSRRFDFDFMRCCCLSVSSPSSLTRSDLAWGRSRRMSGFPGNLPSLDQTGLWPPHAT